MRKFAHELADGDRKGRWEISVNRKILRVSAALACIAPVCAPLWAQNTAELNEVVVTATRVDSTILESPSSVSVISAAQIAESGATDVAQVINGQPGVIVNDYGPKGASQTVSLRGSTSSQVLVLLDGIRLNSSRDGAVDLSSVPMEIIDHIEIVRGGESALYGTMASGGVINIITKKARKPELVLSLVNGSYLPHDAHTVSPALTTTPVSANPMDLVDSQAVTLSLAGKLGDIGVNGGGSFARAANGFTWVDPTGIDDWRRKADADSLSGSGFAGLDAPFLGGDIGLKAVLEISDTGTPGSLTYVSTTARQTDSAASGALSWKTRRFFADALTLDLKAFYRYDELSLNDPASPPVSIHRTRTGSVDVTQKLTLSELAALIYGGSVYDDYADSTNLAGRKNRLNIAGFLSVPVTPTDRLTITPTARYDYFSDFDGSLSYSLSAVLLLSDQSSLRASFGSAYRVPTLNELYWIDPYGDVGNPDLKPETSFSGELGGTLQREGLTCDASAFARLLFNSISWDPSAATYYAVNIGESLQPGAEVHAKAAITDRISVEVGYTFIYSLILQHLGQKVPIAEGRRVPFVPMHTLGVETRYQDASHSFGIGVQYVSKKYTDIANTESGALAGYFVGNADYRLTASENIAFTLALKNIFNTLYYTQSGFPMPPFSIETGVRLHW